MELIEQLAADMAEIKRMLSAMQTPSAQRDIMSADEAAAFLRLKKSTVYKMTSANILPFSKPNGKTLTFSRERLESWLLSNSFKGSNELNNEAATYLVTNKKAAVK